MAETLIVWVTGTVAYRKPVTNDVTVYEPGPDSAVVSSALRRLR